ncbi:MAG TPA: PQQ-binding-like beta-propeller repeat protein [Streptosporangiaceae bacterium]
MNPLAADDPRAIGEFQLRARLGSGGMGRVYLGISPAGRAVAVKVVYPHLARDPQFSGRFKREVAAAQAVNGAYASPVVAAGPDDDPPWLATAFVPGPPLQDMVMGAGPLPEPAVWRLIAGLAEALRAIHASGLVHRDLKPGNVLMAQDGPRVIDFGIARSLDSTVLTAAESVLGTPSYMSPEQARGEKTGPASDMFSLGAVAYFAATGMAPFGDAQAAVLLYRIVYTEADLEPVPPGLRALVAACLSKNPAMRPTPAQLAGGLPVAEAGAPGAFWPDAVARYIANYQAQLDPDAPVRQLPPWGASPEPPPGLPMPSSGLRGLGDTRTRLDPAAPGPGAGRPQDTAPPAGGHQPAGGHHGATQPVSGMGRRRALAALAGMATAGLAIGAWAAIRDEGTTGSGHTDSGNLTSADRAHKPLPPSGTRLWSFPANSSVQSVAASGAIAFAGTYADAVYAMDARTGRQLWRFATDASSNNQLVTAGGSVFAGSDNTGGGITALDASTGKRRWVVDSHGDFGLTVAGHVVYAGTSPKTPVHSGVIAISAAGGETLWTYVLDSGISDVMGGLAAGPGLVYLTTSAGEVIALRAANGTQAWRRALRGASFLEPGPVVSGGVVYAGSQGGTVYALDATSGQELWHRSVGKNATVTVADGLVFASSDSGLAALNTSTGALLWHAAVPQGIFVSTAAGNAVYGAGNDGLLYAWQATTGNKLWAFTTGGPVASNVAVTGGIVFFGSADQHAYAVTA